MSLAFELAPERAYLRRRSTSAIHELPGFVRGRHRLPTGHGRGAEAFVQRLGHDALASEVREVYDSAKAILGLRRREISRALAEGGGNVDAPQFRFALELGLDPADPARASWQRRVVMLRPPASLPNDFDRVFPVACDELVIPLAGAGGDTSADFDELVERLEDFAELHGGGVEEDECLGLAALSTPDGSRIALDLRERELSLRVLGCDGCRSLLEEALRRFSTLADPIVVALSQTTSTDPR
jgi:hypothetical protein